jgi:hemoglobin
MHKNDIESEADIKILVDTFYRKVIEDPIIGFFFTTVVPISWEKHIPVMYTFWGSILLGNQTYHDNPMMKHILLDKKSQLTEVQFDRWLELWETNVNENFSGNTANEAILRAKMIAPLIKHSVTQSRI